jgi:hypothetical protein
MALLRICVKAASHFWRSDSDSAWEIVEAKSAVIPPWAGFQGFYSFNNQPIVNLIWCLFERRGRNKKRAGKRRASPPLTVIFSE